MTIQELAPQIDQALFGSYGKIILSGKAIFILPRGGTSRSVRVRNYEFVTQNAHEASVLGHLAREGTRIVWIEVDGKVRGDGYVNGQYVHNVADYCLGIVSAKV